MVINELIGRNYEVPAIPRPEYYEQAKKAFAIIITGETRAWGCYIIRKGLNVTTDAQATEGNIKLEQYDWGKELNLPEAKR